MITITGTSIRECLEKLSEQVSKDTVLKAFIARQENGKAEIKCEIK